MKAYNVVLKKIESNHNNVRTNETEGQTLALPEVGKNFSLVGASLTPGLTHRVITTTEIKEVETQGDGSYIFKTLNSTYGLVVTGTEEIK